MRNPFLTGNIVYLRAHEERDVEDGWTQWFNDPEVTRFMFKGAFPNTEQAQRLHLERALAGGDLLQLAVCDRADDRLLGVVSLSGFNWVTRCAEFGIAIGAESRPRHTG